MAITLQDYVVPGLCVIPLASASVPCHALLGEVMTTHEHRKPGNSRTLSPVLDFKFQFLFVFKFSSFKKHMGDIDLYLC